MNVEKPPLKQTYKLFIPPRSLAQSVGFYLWFHADLDCLLLIQHVLV